MNPTMQNPNAWVEASPDFINGPEDRAAVNYVVAAKQFDVENNPRYVRGHDKNPNNGLETYCNIFLWDVTKAMSVEVPHWVDPATGIEVPMGKGKELSANTVCDWFEAHGMDFGWMKCNEKQSRKRASVGFPTVGLWKNPGGIGHVVMVLPGMDYTHIAQAGGTNFFDKDISAGYGNLVSKVVFFTHD